MSPFLLSTLSLALRSQHPCTRMPFAEASVCIMPSPMHSAMTASDVRSLWYCQCACQDSYEAVHGATLAEGLKAAYLLDADKKNRN
eukprot:6358091-Pyramimonas_sp.AAC.1